MRFDEKFRRAKPKDLREYPGGMALLGLVAPCFICGNRTGWAHLGSGARACSEECLSKLEFELEGREP